MNLSLACVRSECAVCNTKASQFRTASSEWYCLRCVDDEFVMSSSYDTSLEEQGVVNKLVAHVCGENFRDYGELTGRKTVHTLAIQRRRRTQYSCGS